MSNIQIPTELFGELYAYFVLEDSTSQRAERIKTALEAKMDKVNKRNLYRAFITADDPQNKEEARLKYIETRDRHAQ